jgi:hypothetical protein
MKKILTIIALFLLSINLNFAQTRPPQPPSSPRTDNMPSKDSLPALDSVVMAADNAIVEETPAPAEEKGMDLTSGLVGLVIGTAAGYFLGKAGNKKTE